MKYKITSDSTCDLSPELLKKHDIALFALTVVKDDQPYMDGVTITPSDIFAHVAAGGGLCSTTAGSVGEYQELFEKYANDYDGIIHISLGSEFSSSHQNARLAASEFDNILVIDSGNLSTGQGLVVLKVCQMVDSGATMEQIESEIVEFVNKVEASFLLDQLQYMVKGGRCSAVVALGANLLNLKPCIEVKNGKMSVVKKYRGSYSKCLASYVKDRLSGRDDLDRETLFVTRTPISDECFNAVKEAVDQYADFQNIYWTEAGCTVSCHCGPGTLGVLFVRK